MHLIDLNLSAHFIFCLLYCQLLIYYAVVEYNNFRGLILREISTTMVIIAQVVFLTNRYKVRISISFVIL